MTFIQIYLKALLAIMAMMSILWIISVIIKNVSIVDLFWGIGFIVASTCYYYYGKWKSRSKIDCDVTCCNLGFTIIGLPGLAESWKGRRFPLPEFS